VFLCYLLGLQPWRTIAYAVGIACLLAMCVNILRALP
jgi:glutathione S-transferase